MFTLSQTKNIPTIHGKIYSDKPEFVTLTHWGMNLQKLDSAFLDSGYNELNFKGVSPKDGFHEIYSLNFKFHQLWLHLEKEEVKIDIDLRKSTALGLFDVDNSIFGSPATSELYHYFSDYYNQIGYYLKIYKDSLKLLESDSNKRIELKRKIKAIKAKESPFLIDKIFTLKYPCNILQAFESLIRDKYNLKDFNWIVDSLENKFPNSKEILEDHTLLQVKKISSKKDHNFNTAPFFLLSSENNEIISLEDYKNKYILLDFWASWCTPCINKMPKTIEIQKKYADKGLKVITISIDKDREAWLKAIENHNMQGLINLHDEKGEAAKAYNVSYVPLTVLINPKGEIIGSNIHGEELESKLSEIYTK